MHLAKQMRDDYGIEVKNKNLSYQKPYPSSFDSVSYPVGWRCPEFVKFNGMIIKLLGSMLVNILLN
jgi:hypothetical protein